MRDVYESSSYIGQPGAHAQTTRCCGNAVESFPNAVHGLWCSKLISRRTLRTVSIFLQQVSPACTEADWLPRHRASAVQLHPKGGTYSVSDPSSDCQNCHIFLATGVQGPEVMQPQGQVCLLHCASVHAFTDQMRGRTRYGACKHPRWRHAR